ncbi:primosomal protein [Dietzia sp.]|uniref:primosomal protein n=1 Tax=Dietzia sp. TaxID=1871616 RepID=UPI002FDB14F8
MAKDIVPVFLGLPTGDVTTLWAPEWREDGETWEAFLGDGDDLYGFAETAELIAFVRSGKQHDLDDHPSWAEQESAGVPEFEADEDHSFDLVGVPELLSKKPTESSVDEIDEAFTIARSIGEVCELSDVIKFFDGNPILAKVTGGYDNFADREGIKDWKQIRKIVSKGWDDVLDAIDGILASPKVDEAAKKKAASELESAHEAAAAEKKAREERAASLVDSEYSKGSIWVSAGIDPVRIVLPDGDALTLRCYLGEKPVFLGDRDSVFTFPNARLLSRFLADNDDDTLSRVETYDSIKAAAVDGSLDVEVTDANTYVLSGLADDILIGPAEVDRDQLDLAVELVLDLAAYLDDTELAGPIKKGGPLRRYVNYTLSPEDTTLLEPEGPFDEEFADWRDLVKNVDDVLTSPEEE